MKLYNEDCLETLKNVETESVDLLVTDPPYRIVGGGCSTGAHGNGKGINNPGGILNRDRTKLYNKNCMKVLKDTSDNSVDLLVTDPPYRITTGGPTRGRSDTTGGILNRDSADPVIKDSHGNKYNSDTKHISFCGILNDYDATTYAREGKLFKHNDIKFSTWLPEVYRVLKDGSHAYIMTNPRNLCELETEAKKVGFKWQQLIVWDKGNSVVNKYYLNSYELIVMFRKGRAKNINDMGTKNLLRIPNIIGNKKHPTEKPVELMEILINNSSNVGDIVLDPFMGAGATGVAAIKNNRDFIGIEIDERYFKIAEERLHGEDKEITQMKWSDLE